MPQVNLPRIQLPSEGLLRAQQITQSEAQTRALNQQTALNQQKAQQQAALEQLTQEATQNPQALQALASVAPDHAKNIQDYQSNQILTRGRVAQAFKMTPLADKPKVYQKTIQSLQSQGLDVGDLPAEYDPKLVDSQVDMAINSARDIEKQITQMRGISDVTAPSAVREFQFYKSLPPAQQQEFLNVKRNVLQTGLALTPEGKVEAIEGAPEAKAALKEAEKKGEELGKLDIERRKNLSKANTALKALESQSNIVTKTIDKAIDSISPYSTGYGSYVAFLPNTEARKLKNYLDTIKANVGFDKLQQMRDNSPTGGALGQVSEMENRLLQAVNGALDPAQADQLAENLKNIKSLYPKVLEERKEAFNYDYGQYLPEKERPEIKKRIKRYNPETGRLE